jgi:putative Ca2+/H+ antiporter (TMEM165/GDT1 family)
MEAFFVSTAVVLAAEIGDKTQLLALMLAARYRAPVAVILGIFVATVLNHLAAAWFGSLVAGWLSPEALRWCLAVSFLAMAAWTLVPDKAEDAPEVTTNAGMMIADVPAVFMGNFFSNRLPLKLIRIIAAAIFTILALTIFADIAIGLF